MSNVLMDACFKAVHSLNIMTTVQKIKPPSGQIHHCILITSYLTLTNSRRNFNYFRRYVRLESNILEVISMTDEQNHRPVNTKLQTEIESKLNQHKVPKIDKKPRTRLEKMTLVMSWFMVILMAGSVIYAAISALGWL